MWTQLRLECIGVDAAGELIRIPGEQPDVLPRLYVASLGAQTVRFYRGDVPEPAREFLDGWSFERLQAHPGTVVRVLAVVETDEGPWIGRVCLFKRLPSEHDYLGVRAVDDEWIVDVDNRRASRAFSSRANAEAAELAVETEPGLRRRGFARRCASAWAASQIRQGRAPFYSHRLDNEASRALSESLGVVEKFRAAVF